MTEKEMGEVRKMLKRKNVSATDVKQEFLGMMHQGVITSNWEECAVALTGIYIFGTIVDKWKVVRALQDLPAQAYDFMLQLMSEHSEREAFVTDVNYWEFTKDPLMEDSLGN